MWYGLAAMFSDRDRQRTRWWRRWSGSPQRELAAFSPEAGGCVRIALTAVPPRAQCGLIQIDRVDFVLAMNTHVGHVQGQVVGDGALKVEIPLNGPRILQIRIGHQHRALRDEASSARQAGPARRARCELISDCPGIRAAPVCSLPVAEDGTARPVWSDARRCLE